MATTLVLLLHSLLATLHKGSALPEVLVLDHNHQLPAPLQYPTFTIVHSLTTLSKSAALPPDLPSVGCEGPYKEKECVLLVRVGGKTGRAGACSAGEKMGFSAEQSASLV